MTGSAGNDNICPETPGNRPGTGDFVEKGGGPFRRPRFPGAGDREESVMGKSQDAKKEVKKKATKSLKEKRLEKKARKEVR